MEQGIEEERKRFCALFDLKSQDIRTYSPLTLAYIGDAVYEMIIRSYIVMRGNEPVNKLNRETDSLVKARTQAELIKAVEDILTEEELAVYKRGRNAKSYTMAKNATMADYRKATGCEALMGYLYLDGQYDRMTELVHEGLIRTGMIPDAQASGKARTV